MVLITDSMGAILSGLSLNYRLLVHKKEESWADALPNSARGLSAVEFAVGGRWTLANEALEFALDGRCWFGELLIESSESAPPQDMHHLSKLSNTMVERFRWTAAI